MEVKYFFAIAMWLWGVTQMIISYKVEKVQEGMFFTAGTVWVVGALLLSLN